MLARHPAPGQPLKDGCSSPPDPGAGCLPPLPLPSVSSLCGFRWNNTVNFFLGPSEWTGWLSLQSKGLSRALSPGPGETSIWRPVGDTHTLQGTSLRVTLTSSSEPVSRWVPLMVSVVPPACGPCLGSTLWGWGCWKTGRASGSGLGGDAGPPPSSGLPWATAAFKRPPDPAHICTDLPGTYLVGELGVGR